MKIWPRYGNIESSPCLYYMITSQSARSATRSKHLWLGSLRSQINCSLRSRPLTIPYCWPAASICGPYLVTAGHSWSHLVTHGHNLTSNVSWSHILSWSKLVTTGHNLTSHVTWSHILTWSQLVTPGHKLTSNVTWSHFFTWSHLVTTGHNPKSVPWSL